MPHAPHEGGGQQSSVWSDILGGGTQAAGYASLMDQLNDQRGDTAAAVGGMQDQVGGMTEFQPWSVTSNLGSTSYEDGNLNMSLSDTQQGMSDFQGQGAQSMFGQAMGMDPRFANMASQAGGMANAYGGASQQAMQNSMQNTGAREGDIYERIRAMQRPGEERGRNDMNASLFGSGRGGMSSEAFGGSPEQFAFGKAQSEARNAASFGAMNQAQTEMMNQGSLASQYGGLAGQQQGLGQQALLGGGQLQGMQANIGNQMFQNQYAPWQQQMQQAGMGQNAAQMQQQGQLEGANMWSQLGLGGLTADTNYSNIQGNAFGNMISALGSVGSGIGGAIDDQGGLMSILQNMGLF